MSPRSKKEYLETIFLCYKRSSCEKKLLFLMNYALTVVIIANTLLESFVSLNDLENQK